MTLSASRFSEQDLSDMEQAWQHFECSRNAVSACADQWCEAPEVVSEPVKGPGHYQYDRPAHANTSVSKPAWVPRVCFHRNDFADTIWAVEHGDTACFYRFLFASQSPHYISFQPLDPVGRSLESQYGMVIDGASSSDDELQWDKRFRAVPGCFLDWSEIGVEVLEFVTVVQNCVGIGSFEVVCDWDPTPLQELLDSLGPCIAVPDKKDKEVAPPRAKKPRFDIPPEELAKFPWMAAPETAPRPTGRTFEADGGELMDEEDVLRMETIGVELDDEEMEDLYSRLEKKRGEWAVASGVEAGLVAFKVRILNGQWALAHTGELADYCLGEHRGKEDKAFCDALLGGHSKEHEKKTER